MRFESSAWLLLLLLLLQRDRVRGSGFVTSTRIKSALKRKREEDLLKKRDLSSGSRQEILVVILSGAFIARRKPGVLEYQHDDTTAAFQTM